MGLFSRTLSLIAFKHLPFALLANFGFYSACLKTGVNCWVDFGWIFNQFAISSFLFLSQRCTISTLIPYALITLWAGRLGKNLLLLFNLKVDIFFLIEFYKIILMIDMFDYKKDQI